MTLPSLPEGTLFAGRYQIVRCIAQGGMGAVYEVIHTETERPRALKVMLPELLKSDDMRSRFQLEARVTARINSEYIVDVLDAGIDGATQTPFLVMELLDGEEIEKRLARVGRFEPHEVVSYLHQAALGLDKTHKASIVHRDLKPGNLMLIEREDGSTRVKILDFGIAKIVAESTTAALATQPLGTPVYMAPEQIRLDQKLSPAVDIFALGMIAYTLLVGSPYWHDETAKASNMYGLIAAVMQGPREPPSARAARRGVALPQAFDAWFARITAFTPSDRFPSASAAIIALGEVFGVAVAQRTSTFSGGGQRPSLAGAPPPPPEPALPPNVPPPAEVALHQADPSTSGSVQTLVMRSSFADPVPERIEPIAASAFATGGAVTKTNPTLRKKDARRLIGVGLALAVAGVVAASLAVALRPSAPSDVAQGSEGAAAVVLSSAVVTASAPVPFVAPSPTTADAPTAAPAPTSAPTSSVSARAKSAPPKPTAPAISKPKGSKLGNRPVTTTARPVPTRD